LLDYILVAIGIFATVMASLRFIHMLQLESYQNNMYIKWVYGHIPRDWLPTILAFFICACFDAAIPFLRHFPGVTTTVLLAAQYAVRIFYILLMSLIALSWRRQPAKKPLVYTGRVKRLIAALILIIIAINIIPFTIRSYDYSYGISLLRRLIVYVPALLLPVWVFLANCITLPIENGIKRGYFNQAKQILHERSDMVKIAITGSYGKTSSKFVLGRILSEKFNVFITPHSYNTPMGITRVVREQLRSDHEVFVAEMGARYVGDIDELCDLVAPSIGLLSSIGPQHLETFGSQENIKNTKFELIANLPADGAAFFNGDNAFCAELAKRPVSVKNHFLYGIYSSEELYMRAVNVASGVQGSTFTLVAGDGATIECRTRLLGIHNILNITGAAAIAYYMGLSLQQIAAGIRHLEPVEHRLQLIPGAVTVIDDAFNANPEGAKAALNVLRGFSGRRIIVTPGLVELGKEEDERNRELGQQIACSVDFAILIGEKRSQSILSGIRESCFNMENVFVVNSLEQATAVLNNLTQSGDVVLFENDLPDNYTE